MAKPKKATKTRKRAEKRHAENVGPERRRVSGAADSARVEQFILEEARSVREKKHAPLTKAQIVAIGIAKARGKPGTAPSRGPKGKTKVKERSANAYRKNAGPVMGRKKSTARKSGMGSGHRARSQP